MPPAMKLSVRWEEGDESAHTQLKITLPKSWKEGPTLNLKQLFVEKHNSKHPNDKLDIQKIHLLNPKGEQLADQDVVVKVLNPSDTVRVKPGAPPTLDQVEEARKTSKPIISAKAVDALDDEGHVTSAEALQKAKEKKFAFDYSKWDRLDLSDDDGDDCHPNIDLASWKRLRGRQRTDRRVEEDKKLGKYNSKISKYKKKVESVQKKLAKDESNIQLQVDLKDAETSLKEYEDKLEKFERSRKLIADDVCEVKENKVVIAPETKEVEEPGVTGPQSKQKEYDNYDAFQKDNRHLIKRFATMKDEVESQDFLLAHPSLLNSHAEGFLLILTLDTCMKHQISDLDPTIEKTEEDSKQERRKEYICAKQHLTIHYICELGKSMRRNPLDGVKPFYRKTGPRSEDRVEGFEEDLTKFLDRIRKRATEKIKNGELNPLVDAESSLVQAAEVVYQPAGMGPGGLDPNEVLQSLPEVLQQAFVDQDLDRLREAFESLPDEEAEYHLQRCVDSGLWVPGGASDEEEEGEVEVTSTPTEGIAPAPGPVVDDIE